MPLLEVILSKASPLREIIIVNVANWKQLNKN
jgi:hypothetical protein